MEYNDKPHSLLCHDNEALEGYAWDYFNTASIFTLLELCTESLGFHMLLPGGDSDLSFNKIRSLCMKMSAVNYGQIYEVLAIADVLNTQLGSKIRRKAWQL